MTRGPAALLALVVAVAATVTLWCYAGGTTQPEPLAIAAVAGDVVRVRDATETPGRVGMHLSPGDRLVTGDDGTATISRGAGTSIEIAPGSSVELSRIDDGLVDVVVEHGRVRARVRPDGGGLRVAAAGRSVLATDAAFGVSVDDGAIAIETQRGSVAVAGVPGVARVDGGSRLHVFPDGQAVLRPVSDALLLDVAWPEPVTTGTARVTGTTEPGASVRIVDPPSTEPPARADADGRFALELPLTDGRTEVEVAVRDAFGRERRARGVLERLTAGGGPSFRLELDYERR